MSSSDRFTPIAVGAAMLVTVTLFMVVHAPSIAWAPKHTIAEPTSVATTSQQPAHPTAPPSQAVNEGPVDVPTGAAVPAAFVATSRIDTHSKHRGLLEDLASASRDVARGELASIAGHLLPTLAEVQVYRDADQRMVVTPGTSRRYAEAVSKLLAVDPATIAAAIDSERADLAANGLDPATDSSALPIVDAIDRFLAVELPQVAADMAPQPTHWDFADPDYRALSTAQKHLLLMSLPNARKVQAKLREIRTLIAGAPQASDPGVPSFSRSDALPRIAAVVTGDPTPIGSMASAP